MSDPAHTHITVILDRTGSMASIRDETIAGFNEFVRQQRQQPGRATLTLIQFDTHDPFEVLYRFQDIQEVPTLTRETFVPRAHTPLWDAIGRGILDLEASLAGLAEEKRPGKVVAAILTDGQQNSSEEFDKNTVKRLIEQKIEQAGSFSSLSVDPLSAQDALDVGIPKHSEMPFVATEARQV